MVLSLPVIILILLLIGALLFIVHLYTRLTTAYNALEKEDRKLKAQIHHRSAYLIEETKKKSLQILGDANIKAQELINQAQLIDVSAKDTFAQQMQEVAAKQKASLETLVVQLEAIHKEVVTAAQKEEQRVATTVATALQQEVNTEIASFAKTLEGETVTYQKMVDQKVSAEYQRILKELEAYKAERMKQFEATLPHMMTSVIQRILGRVISLQDHEKLILQAIETAKKEQITNT